ncbi:hypothetical protein [Devosia sp. 1566]|uniref:hypothetical protein n=1 Tax=Devosia sp. 1566 TaxID=2499144 RepID=UPI000FD7A985|nr:hypothetical protein [Devosia sp. 1566]
MTLNITIDLNEPNRLLDCQVRVISVGEHHLGILELDTDQGFLPISVNPSAAATLITALAEFMAATEVDQEIPIANDDDPVD